MMSQGVRDEGGRDDGSGSEGEEVWGYVMVYGVWV